MSFLTPHIGRRRKLYDQMRGAEAEVIDGGVQAAGESAQSILLRIRDDREENHLLLGAHDLEHEAFEDDPTEPFDVPCSREVLPEAEASQQSLGEATSGEASQPQPSGSAMTSRAQCSQVPRRRFAEVAHKKRRTVSPEHDETNVFLALCAKSMYQHMNPACPREHVSDLTDNQRLLMAYGKEFDNLPRHKVHYILGKLSNLLADAHSEMDYSVGFGAATN